MLTKKFLLLCILINTCFALQNPCRKGLNGNHFFPHPEFPSKYIHCSQWGQMFVFDCGQGLIWDSSKNTCERKDIFHFFQNLPNSLHTTTRSNFQQPDALFQTSRSPINSVTRIVSNLPTQRSNSFPTSPETKSTILENNVQSATQMFTFPSTTFRPTTTTRPITTTSTTTTRPITATTTTTTFEAPVQALVPEPPQTIQNFQADQSLSPSVDCSSFSISGSRIPSVNGIYSRINSNIIRRSDNFRIPGLIVHLDRSLWCVTLAFSFTDLNSINLELIKSQCGPNLECCMLISNSPENLDVTDPRREWNLNVMNAKGVRDNSIRFNCENLKKCPRIPFCPPECLQTVNGCEVCECNGKPFFDINSGQRLLSLTKNNERPTVSVLGGRIQKKIEIVTRCISAKCPRGFICAEARNCPTCNPLCFPHGNLNISNSIKLTCNDIICPNSSKCLIDTADNLLKCITVEIIQPSQAEIDIQALVQLQDELQNQRMLLPLITPVSTTSTTTTTLQPITTTTTKTTTTTTTTTTTSTTTTTITTTTLAETSSVQTELISSIMSDQPLIANFTIRRCSMVRCPQGFICAEANNCMTCSPLCFPPNQFDLSKAIKPSCESAMCPDNLKCLVDFKENNLKCIA